LTFPLAIIAPCEIVATGKKQYMVVFSTKILNDMRPPGDTAFSFGGSATGIDLAFRASIVSDDH
jgi:hypothetical protein